MSEKLTCHLLYNDLLEDVALGYQSLDEKACFLETNSHLCKMLGYSKDELIGMSFYDLLAKEFQPGFYEGFENFKKIGKYRDLEFSLKRKDGKILFLTFDGKACYDKKHNFMHSHCIVRDITEQRESEEALKQSENLFKCLVNNSPNGILYFDVKGNIIYANPTLLRIIGSPSVELTKKINLLEFKNLVDAGVPDQIELAIKNKSNVQFECTYNSLWGKISALSFSIMPILNEDGEVDKLMSIIQDISESKEAEAKLIESENKYRTIADYTSEWEYWIDNKNNYLYMSPACLDITGYAREEFQNNKDLLLSIVHHDDKELVRKHCSDSVMRSREEIKYNFRIITKSGKTRWFEHKCRPVIDDRDNVIGRRGINSDITEIHEALENVRISQRNYFNIFEGVSEGIIYVDSDGFINDVNSGFIKITGLERRDILKRHIVVVVRDLISKENMKQVMSIIASNLNGKQTPPFELEWRDKIFKISTRTGFDIKGIIGVISDITEIKKAENALRESELKFRKVLENINLMGIMLDLEGRITFCNDYLLKVTGFTRKEVMNQRWIRTFIPIRERENVKNIFDKSVKESGQPYQFECRMITKDGNQLIVSWHNTIIKGKKDEIIGVTGIGNDITEKREKEIINEYYFSLADRLQKSKTSHEKFEICLSFLMELTKYESGGIYLLEEDKFVMHYFHGLSEKFINTIRIVPDSPEIREALSHKREINIDDFSEPVAMKELLLEENYKSFFVIPFIFMETVSGSINLASRSLNAIDPLNRKILDSTIEYIQFTIHRVIYEEEILKSRNSYRSVVKALDEGVIVYNEKGDPVTTNESAERILGLPAERILGLSIYSESWVTVDLSGNNFPKEKYPVIKTLNTGEAQHDIIFGFYRPEGELRWLSNNTQPIFEGNPPKLSAVVVSFFDITERLVSERELGKYRHHLEELVNERTVKLEQEIDERIKVEEALRESEEKYRLMTENALDIIIRYRFYPISGYEYVSPASTKVIGYTPGEFYNDPDIKKKIIHPDDLYLLEADYLKKISPSDTIQIRMIHKNGKMIWVEESMRLLFDSKCNVIAREGIARDISERKKLESTLLKSLESEKELSEMRSRFISTVSHEFRTPLSAVLSSAELLHQYGKKWSEEKFNSHTKKMIGAIDYLTNLLDNIFMISQMDISKLELSPSKVNLKELCAKIVDEFSSVNSPEHKIEFEYDSPNERYILDEKLFSLIISNLLTNAIKFSPDGGIIKLSLTQKDKLVLKVSDEGIGILPEEQNKVTESFFRGKNAEAIAGSGLGLSIIKRAVELHHGDLKINNRNSKGVEVIITLPAEAVK